MILREAKIDDAQYEWTSFERGLTYCQTAKRMAQWWLQSEDSLSLPKTLKIRVRDVGSELEFMHVVVVRHSIEVTPMRNDEDREAYPNLCVVCRESLDIGWDYAACKKCAEEFDYDFVQDDMNFDSANGR